MTDVVQLLAIDRADCAGRLVVRLAPHAHLEIGQERRTLDGWALDRRVTFELADLELEGDAFDRAIALRKAAAR